MDAATIKTCSRKIPASLIYDEIDSKPYYRKRYKSVLNKSQTLESVIGCSSIQALIIEHFAEKFYALDYTNDFYFFTGEPGFHLSVGNNLVGDICLYKRSQLSGAVFNNEYLQVPPYVQIEFDVSVDLTNDSETAYIFRKTRTLLAHHVLKVIWIFTTSQSILVATPSGPWQWMDWSNDVDILEGYTVNIGRFMATQNL